MTRTLRRVLVVTLLVAALFILWRAARLGWLGWQTAEVGRQVLSEAQSAPNTELRSARLASLSSHLDKLNDEIQPLAPLLQALGWVPGYGPALAAGPELARSAAALGPHLAWLLGMDAPRTYLLLVQNNHELRATGGFISAFGRLVVDGGKIVDLQFVDSYEVFSLQSEYPPAPQPMNDYMGIQLQVARDANWSPDLPTAAAAILPLYTQDTGVAVDGILTLDLYALAHLVGALPGLRVEGVDEALTPVNLEAILIRLWDQPSASGANSVGANEAGANEAGANSAGANGADWWAQRKDFMPLIGAAMLERIQGMRDPAALAALASAVAAGFGDRSLQLWVRDPATQKTLAALGWDGSLQPAAGADFLAVVDSNLGYNKVNAVVTRSMDYRVDWIDGAGEATLTLTYTHPISSEVAVCDPAANYGDSYSDLFERCYFDYIRIYVPAESKLGDIQGVTPESRSAAVEKGLQVFAGFQVLPPNRTQTVTFSYTLPPQITPEGYRLRIQRQSGTPPLPVTVTAGGATAAQVVDGNTWGWTPGSTGVTGSSRQ